MHRNRIAGRATLPQRFVERLLGMLVGAAGNIVIDDGGSIGILLGRFHHYLVGVMLRIMPRVRRRHAAPGETS
ncbi:MAG: hypothetical protein V4724_38100 [Pseudomonadota bacterium]